MAKGTVTNEIQYRGYNTVRMNPGDSFNCYEFFIKAGDYISHSFAIYSVSPLAGATRARTRFIGANGLTISTSSHTVATTGGTFDEIAIEGVPVPTGAHLGRLELLSPSGTYWVAMPKSEDGEKATPYSQNFSGQMTHITPTGVYTGIIQANQINLTSGGDLEESMTTINNQVIHMTSSFSSLNADVTTIKAGQAEFVKFSDVDGSKSTTIIDGGTIKTGTISADKIAAGELVAGALTNDPNMNTYATIGYPAEGGVGISIYEKNYPDVYMGRFGTAAFGISLDHQGRLIIGDNNYLRDKNDVNRIFIGDYTTLRDKGGVSRLQIDDETFLRDKNNAVRLRISDNNIYLKDRNDVSRLQIGDETYLRDKNNVVRLRIGDYTFLMDKDDEVRLWIDPNGNTFFQNAANSHAIGVDGSGPYFVKNGVKTYL